MWSWIHVRGLGRDPVGEDREHERVPVGGVAVADEVGDARERARLALAAARARRCRACVRRACRSPRPRPCCRAAPARSGSGELHEQVGDLIRRGFVLLRRAPSRRRRRGWMPSSDGDRLAHDGRARRGRARAAVARAEVLDERLGEEVVRRRQHQAEQLRDGRRGTLRELGRAGRRRRRAACAGDAHAVALQRSPAARGRRRRRGRAATALRPALAAVEREAAERAFEERVGRVVARGLAAQRVEPGLVAVDRAA